MVRDVSSSLVDHEKQGARNSEIKEAAAHFGNPKAESENSDPDIRHNWAIAEK
jgi:hypothetical protein